MIIVFGSLNMDMSLNLDTLPVAGETVLAESSILLPGGKGGNQALAAARAGEKVAMVGCVGDDDMGDSLLLTLRKNSVMTSGVSKSEKPTAMAVVCVDKKGENQIIVASNANYDATHDQVPDEILVEGNLLLMQMELPAQQNLDLMRRAKERDVITMLNLAPALKIPDESLEYLDYLIVNSIEGRQMAEQLGLTFRDDGAKLAEALSKAGGLNCILTMGPRGSVAHTKDNKSFHVPAVTHEDDDIADLTGAGDCYCGTLAMAIHNKMDLEKAMRYASVAASLSVLKEGAQTSYPFQADIEAKYKELFES